MRVCVCVCVCACVRVQHWAASKGDELSTALLLKCGLQPSALVPTTGNNVLHEAAANGSLAAVRVPPDARMAMHLVQCALHALDCATVCRASYSFLLMHDRRSLQSSMQ